MNIPDGERKGIQAGTAAYAQPERTIRLIKLQRSIKLPPALQETKASEFTLNFQQPRASQLADVFYSSIVEE